MARSPALTAVLLLAVIGPPVRASQDSAERERWSALAARCGAELRWAADWEEAAARARAERKPVLAIAWMYEIFDVANGALQGFAMDPDAIELVNERFVPLALTKKSVVPFAAQESYGISASALGAALLVVSPGGEMLADATLLEPTTACEFLRDFLAAHPDFPGAPVADGASSEERAARHLARGELDAAAAALGEPRSARGFMLKAKTLRLRRELGPALDVLRAAREAGAGDLAPEIDLEELFLLTGLAHLPEARALAGRMQSAHGTHESARAAEYVLGLLDVASDPSAAARLRLRALAVRHPDSRWACLAAALLLAEPAELELGLELSATPDDLPASTRRVPWETASAVEAERDAVRYLLAAQRVDGGWPDASEFGYGNAFVNDVSEAVDALAARELLARGERGAAERAARLLARERSSLRTWKGPMAMSYVAWGRSAWLELLCDLLAAGADDAAELRALGADLAQELVDCQRENGGWSYFYSTSMKADAVTLEQSISFVTAAVAKSLLRAQAAGIEIDEDALAAALDALEAMRDEDGVFAYMLWTFQERAEPEKLVAGAAGRGPVCELALFHAERSDLARLRGALDLFFTHVPLLARERGKALMHCGAEGQGCHYVLFDYATAAEAIAALLADERAPYRERLLTRLLECRRADGSFLDAPVIGPVAGTAMALAALRALGPLE